MRAFEFGKDYTDLIKKQKDEKSKLLPGGLLTSVLPKKEIPKINEGFGDEEDSRITLLADTVQIKITEWKNNKPKDGYEYYFQMYKIIHPMTYFFQLVLLFNLFFRYPNWCLQLGHDIRSDCRHLIITNSYVNRSIFPLYNSDYIETFISVTFVLLTIMRCVKLLLTVHVKEEKVVCVILFMITFFRFIAQFLEAISTSHFGVSGVLVVIYLMVYSNKLRRSLKKLGCIMYNGSEILVIYF